MEQTASTRRLAAGLFLTFFTAQSAFVVLAPTLTQVSHEFGVSVARAGQLRTVAAIAGFLAAAAIAVVAPRVGVARLLRGGLLVLAVGAIASSAAPSFGLLALAQVVIGVGAAAVLTAGLAAAADWSDPGRRADVLAWTIVGQPAAWVAALPVIGRLSDLGWRWAWLVVPLAATSAFAVVPASRRDTAAAAGAAPRRAAWRNPDVRRWAFGELMAYAGWGGTLVYAGALLAQTYDLGPDSVSLLLAAGATTYFAGTFAIRRRLDGNLQLLLPVLALALAGGVLAFGTIRTGPATSTALFAVLVLLAGARGIAGGAFGLSAAPAEKVSIGSIRSGATQLGYLVGASGGGLALQLGGYSAVGVVLALFFAAAAVPYLARVPALTAPTAPCPS
jgi:predicted MFS family arabinose efflux permease